MTWILHPLSLLRPSGRALDNARTAALRLAATVTDRLELTGDADADSDEPGHLQTLTRSECYDVLRSVPLGRYAYIARQGVPDVVPVNFLLDGEDVLIRTGPGPSLQAAERHERVAFEVDVVDLETRTGTSVVVHGTATRCGSAEQDALAERTAGTAWAAGPRRHVIRIRPTRVTGRRLV
jgi:nitroimidazol reductase NimA-like FMN-containing flavoprotein (pyridoxamine 5'-phosphate oxidase superfamily)